MLLYAAGFRGIVASGVLRTGRSHRILVWYSGWKLRRMQLLVVLEKVM